MLLIDFKTIEATQASQLIRSALLEMYQLNTDPAWILHTWKNKKCFLVLLLGNLKALQ